MLLPVSGKFNGNDPGASLTENLCYRCREINPFAAP